MKLLDLGQLFQFREPKIKENLAVLKGIKPLYKNKRKMLRTLLRIKI